MNRSIITNKKGGKVPVALPKGFRPDRTSVPYVWLDLLRVNEGPKIDPITSDSFHFSAAAAIMAHLRAALAEIEAVSEELATNEVSA